MSEDRIKRRRFIADLLFAGGGVAAAALVSRWALRAEASEPEPGATPSHTPRSNTPTPVKTCEPEPALDGDVMIEPTVKGKVQAATPTPQVPMPGEMVAPQVATPAPPQQR